MLGSGLGVFKKANKLENELSKLEQKKKPMTKLSNIKNIITNKLRRDLNILQAKSKFKIGKKLILKYKLTKALEEEFKIKVKLRKIDNKIDKIRKKLEPLKTKLAKMGISI